MISIIVPTHNRDEMVFELTQSLLRQKVSVPFEIVIVSNLPSPHLENSLSIFNQESVKYFSHGTIGANRARNLGVKKSSGNIFLFLDDDCLIEEESFLERHWKEHQERQNAVAVGGRYKLAYPATSWEQAYFFGADSWLLSSRYSEFFTSQLIGGNVSYKRRAFFDDSGNFSGFEESIVWGGSESEFNLRLLQEGKKLVLLDDLFVTHKVDMSFKEFLKKSFKQGHSFQKRKQKKTNPPRAISVKIEEWQRQNPPKPPPRYLNSQIDVYRAFFSVGRLSAMAGLSL